MTQVELPADDVLSSPTFGLKVSTEATPMDEETALFHSTLLGVLACSGVKIKTRITGNQIDFDLPFKNFSNVRFTLG